MTEANSNISASDARSASQGGERKEGNERYLAGENHPQHLIQKMLQCSISALLILDFFFSVLRVPPGYRSD
jgi:hypothetical protein